MKTKHLLNSLFATLALLAVPGLRAATYVETVLDAGPAAYWRFESVNDTSLSNGFVNIFQGNATVTAAGQGVPLSGVANNRALLLDGDGDSVSTGVTNQLTFASSGTFFASERELARLDRRRCDTNVRLTLLVTSSVCNPTIRSVAPPGIGTTLVII